jgi:dGTPase
MEDAQQTVAKFRELWEAAEMQFPGAPESVRVQEVVRGLINWLVTGLIEGTLAATAGIGNAEQVRQHPGRVARFSAETAAGTAELKRFLRARVYNSEGVTHSRTESARRIEALFEFFLENPGQLPAGHRESPPREPLHRRVCDYIAGMTDGYFLRTCQQMGIQEPRA